MKSGRFAAGLAFTTAARAGFAFAAPATGRLSHTALGSPLSRAREHERLGSPSLACGYGGHRPSRGDGAVLHEESVTIVLPGFRVAMFDQQPVRAFAVRPIVLHAHEDPAAVKAGAMKREFQVSAGERFLGRTIAFRFPISAIPELDRAAAVLSLRDRSFEIAIIERMVFDFDREALLVGVERGALGDRPRLEHPIELETQIIVQATGVMFLNDEAPAVRRGDLFFPARLGGLREIALRNIGRKFLSAGHRRPLQDLPAR